MVDVTLIGDRATGSARVRLNRPILISNLVSGAVWLLPLLVFLVDWILFLVVAVYVVAGSVFLAAVYAHEVLPRRQEALAWIAPWLLAVALWTTIGIGLSFENTVSHYLISLFGGLIIATLGYLAWQILALPIRQFLAWRSGRSFVPT